MSRFYTWFYLLRFLCDYDMAWYPFDIQLCQLNLVMKGKSGDFADLGKKKTRTEGPENADHAVDQLRSFIISQQYHAVKMLRV